MTDHAHEHAHLADGSHDVIVIGGGIAGLACARFLVEGGRRVVLLERAPRLFDRASGKNAAIFRHAEPSALLVSLVVESRRLLDERAGGAPWNDMRGAVYLAPTRDALVPMVDALATHAVAHDILDESALARAVPDVDVRGQVGLMVPGDGVLDLARVEHVLRDDARVDVRTSVGVRAVGAGGTPRVILDDGRTITARAVVVAAGAHAGDLAGLPLTPMRRHLGELARAERPPMHPVVWRVDDEVYYRPTSPALVSPCDEVKAAPDDDVVRTGAQEALTRKLSSLLSYAAPIERMWACLRTYADDRLPVAGAVPANQGVFVVGALGGVGMSAGVAVARAAARAIVDGVEHESLTPRRLTRSQSP